MRGVLAVTGKTEATSEPGCRSVLRLLWSRWSKSLLTMMTLCWCLLPQHGTFCASLCRLSAVAFAVRDYVIVIRLYLYLHCQLYSFILVFFFWFGILCFIVGCFLLRGCRFGVFVCARALYSVWRMKRRRLFRELCWIAPSWCRVRHGLGWETLWIGLVGWLWPRFRFGNHWYTVDAVSFKLWFMNV